MFSLAEVTGPSIMHSAMTYSSNKSWTQRGNSGIYTQHNAASNLRSVSSIPGSVNFCLHDADVYRILPYCVFAKIAKQTTSLHRTMILYHHNASNTSCHFSAIIILLSPLYVRSLVEPKGGREKLDGKFDPKSERRHRRRLSQFLPFDWLRNCQSWPATASCLEILHLQMNKFLTLPIPYRSFIIFFTPSACLYE